MFKRGSKCNFNILNVYQNSYEGPNYQFFCCLKYHAMIVLCYNTLHLNILLSVLCTEKSIFFLLRFKENLVPSKCVFTVSVSFHTEM